LPDHPLRARDAAIEMLHAMDTLNAAWKARAAEEGRSIADVKIGIGINTGECCVGNLGSRQRFDYSAIGDQVNLTSRLEGLTKVYGLPVVVGEQTAALLPRDGVFEIDLIQVKGRRQATRIYTLSALLDRTPADLARLRERQEAFLIEYRARQWEAAEAALGRCRAEGCGALETYYRIFGERISALRTKNLPADWDGTSAMLEK
jgi:adenylate cyclase